MLIIYSIIIHTTIIILQEVSKLNLLFRVIIVRLDFFLAKRSRSDVLKDILY